MARRLQELPEHNYQGECPFLLEWIKHQDNFPTQSICSQPPARKVSLAPSKDRGVKSHLTKNFSANRLLANGPDGPPIFLIESRKHSGCYLSIV